MLTAISLDKKRSTKRPTKPPHFGIILNQKTFDDAYASITAAGVAAEYFTVAGTLFTAEANIVKRGRHKGEPVIVFKQAGKEMARSYVCCWGHVTNCNRTYISPYTPVV